ncbi:hypothetical protein NDU88_004421 [Pleurodeles waltl]|uniref:Uncharacterized protein n=1 Tax=Pleurodeles waltl TaxID=8319 RepID=A0AAV7T833_PLEWA|nr:hypothetical protein NDU88_004421 [Pleurodeles waltl]
MRRRLCFVPLHSSRHWPSAVGRTCFPRFSARPELRQSSRVRSSGASSVPPLSCRSSLPPWPFFFLYDGAHHIGSIGLQKMNLTDTGPLFRKQIKIAADE